MTESWCTFVISLIASFLGAGFGVFLTLLLNKRIEKRRLRGRTQDVASRLRTEVIDNCSILDSLIAEIEGFDESAKARKSLPTPFLLAKLKSDSYQYAVQNNLIPYLDEVTQHQGLGITLGHYYEHCTGINSLLIRFEEYVSHFLMPFPDPQDQTSWETTEEEISRWTREICPVLVSELKHSCAVAETLGASYDDLVHYKLKYHGRW